MVSLGSAELLAASTKIKNESYSVTAEMTTPDTGATGTIIAQCGAFGGQSVFVRDSTFKYCYNLLGQVRSQWRTGFHRLGHRKWLGRLWWEATMERQRAERCGRDRLMPAPPA